jgi:hypothetical protein
LFSSKQAEEAPENRISGDDNDCRPSESAKKRAQNRVQQVQEDEHECISDERKKDLSVHNSPFLFQSYDNG